MSFEKSRSKMNHQFMKLGDAYLENSFITSDSYLRHSEICDKCIYHRSDAIFRKRIWRGDIHFSLLKPIFKDRDKNLILGHSDQKTNVATIKFLQVASPFLLFLPEFLCCFAPSLLDSLLSLICKIPFLLFWWK